MQRLCSRSYGSMHAVLMACWASERHCSMSNCFEVPVAPVSLQAQVVLVAHQLESASFSHCGQLRTVSLRCRCPAAWWGVWLACA